MSFTTKVRNVWGTRTVNVYETIEQIGEGTYGKVSLGIRDASSNAPINANASLYH